MLRHVLFCSVFLSLVPTLVIGQPTETPVLVSGTGLVPVDTDGTTGPSAGDDGFETYYLPSEDCFVVLGTGVLGAPVLSRGVVSAQPSAFNFRQSVGVTGTVVLEEIGQCGPYFDSRFLTYTGVLSDSTSPDSPTSEYDTFSIQQQSYSQERQTTSQPRGQGRLVDTNNDGFFDAVQGTMSNGMPLSVLVDMQFYPDAANPTHLIIPGRFRRTDNGQRIVTNAYIPVNPDGSITAVRADNNAAFGGVCLTSGVVVGALPTNCRLPGAAPSDPVGIPLLSRWGMAGLMLTLLGVTVFGMRRFQS